MAVGTVAMRLPLAFFEKASPAAFHLALVYVPVLFFAFALPDLLVALRNFTWSAIITTAATAAVLLLSIILLSIFPGSVIAALLALIIGQSLSILMSLIVLRWKYRIKPVRPSLGRLWEMLSYGMRYYVGKVSSRINLDVGTIILALLASKSDVGFFVVAVRATTQALLIPETLTAVLMPRVAADEEGRRELVAQCCRVAAVICAMMLGVLAVLATPIVRIVFSPEFLPVVLLIRILAVGVLVRCACRVFYSYLVGTNRPGAVSVAVAAGVGANLALLWRLFPAMGLPGAAVAMTAGFFVSSTILMLSFSRFSRMPLREVWRFKRSDWSAFGRIVQGLRGRLAGSARDNP